MNQKKKAKMLRNLLFTSFLLAVLFTLLSGLGTYCAAFKTEQYPRMADLLPYQLLYQAFVVVSTSIGLWGIWEFVAFWRNKTDLYRNAITILSLGFLAGAIQMISSEIIRGTSIPVNFRVYVTLATLLFFIYVKFRPAGTLIGLVDAGGEVNPAMPATGSALVIGGILTLTTQFWVGDSHFAENGYNWVNDLKGYLLVFGGGLVFAGVGLWLLALKHKLKSLAAQTGPSKTA